MPPGMGGSSPLKAASFRSVEWTGHSAPSGPFRSRSGFLVSVRGPAQRGPSRTPLVPSERRPLAGVVSFLRGSLPSSSPAERVCLPPSCRVCPGREPGTPQVSVNVHTRTCRKCSWVSLVEKSVRPARGAGAGFCESELAAGRESGRCLPGDPLPRNLPLASPTCAPPRTEECRAFLETLPAGPLEGG